MLTSICLYLQGAHVCAVCDHFFYSTVKFPCCETSETAPKERREKKKKQTNTQVMFTNAYDQLKLYETGQENVFLAALEGMVIIYNHYF